MLLAISVGSEAINVLSNVDYAVQVVNVVYYSFRLIMLSDNYLKYSNRHYYQNYTYTKYFQVIQFEK